MHEKVMQLNYKKAYKWVVLLALVLAVVSAVVIPLSLSQQIRDVAALEQTYHENHSAAQRDSHDGEEAWKNQITPLTGMHFAVFGVVGVLWLALLAYYWLLTAAWLYRSAVNEGMNKSLWMILGLAGNLLAVAAFLIVRDAPQRAKEGGVTMGMITPLHGFSMALADSVPGVSGGTVAFILGFYDKFIGALHDLFSRDRAARRRALGYLLRLGIGWAAGMGLCVSLLASLFSVHIYFMSSLFLGLTVASIPFVALAEKNALRRWQFFPFALVGAALVAGLTMLRSGSGLLTVDMTQPGLVGAAYLFLAGAVAITAMVLPGISGSSVLLIAGVYLPVIQAIRQFLHLDLRVVPGLLSLGLGVIAGVALSIHAIRTALQKYRPAMIWLILGLMLGSLYAICMGPASLQMPQPPLSAASFRPLAFLLGAALLVGLELLRQRMERGVAAA